MDKQQIQAERKTLILALIAGICATATLTALFSSYVAFSIFPILALGMAVFSLYQEYLRKPMTEGAAPIATAIFFVGAFGYSGFQRAMTPEMGSNFLSLMIALGLLFWVSFKLGLTGHKKTDVVEQN